MIQLYTIPRKEAEPYRILWERFLPELTVEGIITVEDLERHIRDGSLQLHLIVEEPDVVRGIFGTRAYWCGKVKIGEIAECAGVGLEDWVHLVPELENFLIQNDGAQEIWIERARPGWRSIAARLGYRTKYITVRKVL